jgi:hypothetical protein
MSQGMDTSAAMGYLCCFPANNELTHRKISMFIAKLSRRYHRQSRYFAGARPEIRTCAEIAGLETGGRGSSLSERGVLGLQGKMEAQNVRGRVGVVSGLFGVHCPLGRIPEVDAAANAAAAVRDTQVAEQ